MCALLLCLLVGCIRWCLGLTEDASFVANLQTSPLVDTTTGPSSVAFAGVYDGSTEDTDTSATVTRIRTGVHGSDEYL